MLTLMWLLAKRAVTAVVDAPSWVYMVGGVVLLCLMFEVHGRAVVRTEWTLAEAKRDERERMSLLSAYEHNEQVKAKQGEVNDLLKKGYDSEIIDIRTMYNAERLRVGPKFCGDSAVPTIANSPGGSDGAVATTRVLPEDIERDIKALGQTLETAMTACRVAQQFLIQNHLAP